MDSSNEDELLSLDSDSDKEHCGNTASKKKKVRKNDRQPQEKLPTLSSNYNLSNGSSDEDGPEVGTSASIVMASGSTNGSADLSIRNGVSGSDDSDDDSGNESVPRVDKNRSCNKEGENSEITLSDEDDDEDEGEIGENNQGTTSGSSSNSQDSAVASDDANGQGTSSSSAGYGLRRKRKINYEEIENGLDTDDKFPTDGKSKLKKEVLDIFSLSNSKISKYTQNPDLIDNYTKCKIVFMHGTDSARLDCVSKFFEKCGQQFESMFVQIRYDEETLSFLKHVFKHCTILSRLDYRYQSQDEAYHLLKLIKTLTDANSLASFTSLRLISVSGSESLCEKHINLFPEMRVKFQSLELGDSLWEDVKADTLEKFLDKQKSSLETLIINGGFRGDTHKEKVLISFPKMEILKSLCICPKYTFLSEFKNPYSKKARVITLEVHKNEEPFKIAIKFGSELPNLRRLVLGNLIDIEDLLFSSVRKLTEFRCGSYWNLSIRFPSEGSRKALLESTVTEFQFPDALKDPIFTVKVSKHFPNLKKVWLYLPSVPVLRAFFKAFENSKLEELYLKTQFDFEKTMESCLLPNMQDVLQKSQETETLLQTLREYKHFDEYIRYYNVELPVEADDLMEGHSAGIGALKSLKVLHLEHIPRTLLIPIPDDERKWYDHNCKFMSSTFGYERYPLNYRCHKEILKLDLSEYIWKNIQVSTRYTEEFNQAGFVNMSDVQIIHETNVNSGYGYYEAEEEDIFTPVQRSTPKGAQVKIMPSMLMPSIKAKAEEM